MSIGDFTTKKNAANAEERELNAQANKDEDDSNVRSMKDLVGNGIGHFHKAIEAGLESDLNAGAFAEGAKKLTPLESLDQTSS